MFYNDSKIKPKGHGFGHKTPYQDYVYFSDLHKMGGSNTDVLGQLFLIGGS